MSGVTLATTIRSMSAAFVFVCCRRHLAASVAMWDVAMPLSTTCRSRMPVRVRIHSSFVSSNFDKSSFVMTRGGTKPATPEIFAAMR